MTGWGRWSWQGFSNSGGIKEAFCMDDPINPPAFPAAIFSMLEGSKQAQNCKAFGLGTHSREEMDAIQTWAVFFLLLLLILSSTFLFTPECTYLSISWTMQSHEATAKDISVHGSLEMSQCLTKQRLPELYLASAFDLCAYS